MRVCFALWQQGLKPNAHCLQMTNKTGCLSLKEAIDRARRHEAAGLAGAHVCAFYHPVPHRALNRLASNPFAQNLCTTRVYRKQALKRLCGCAFLSFDAVVYDRIESLAC